MSWPSRLELHHAEANLRTYDRALRLRFCGEEPNTILIERKTFRGRIGTMSPGCIPWSPNTGRRKEEGHVSVGGIHASLFHTASLLDALKYADTWQRWDRNAKPLWQRVEEADELKQRMKMLARKDGLRYRSSELFDRYVWKYGQRVSVPVAIR